MYHFHQKQLFHERIAVFISLMNFTKGTDYGAEMIFLSRYFRAVRRPPQDSERSKEDRWE
ncbi:hypothetical protein CG478_006135 [Bacillus cytotoxicus]|nr:hypothetical protein CG483_009120 [Bacillus cytotoxicus]AWC40095.1 hypothetical protein CG480_006135 [Bacillus cytotoxicus]AWC48026.1 hypothetical protein CG478_006135 [Bacillus cytotoxicus]AWC52589.1 hypothetical protein CG477_009080 [Bacillus cytotoxicus]AWC56721.1 hypothetical protein CG476_009110 [Bacillus cytotoxicus]